MKERVKCPRCLIQLMFSLGLYLVYASSKSSGGTAYLFDLFDLIFYVHSTIFQLCGTGLPGLNQY